MEVVAAELDAIVKAYGVDVETTTSPSSRDIPTDTGGASRPSAVTTFGASTGQRVTVAPPPRRRLLPIFGAAAAGVVGSEEHVLLDIAGLIPSDMPTGKIGKLATSQARFDPLAWPPPRVARDALIISRRLRRLRSATYARGGPETATAIESAWTSASRDARPGGCMAAPRMQNDRPNNYQVAPRSDERERRRGRIAPSRRSLPYIFGAAVGMAIVCAVIARPSETALAAMAAAVPDQTANHVFSPLTSRRVISSPPGAELLRHGAVLGTTPIELELTQSEEAEPVTLRLAGYLEQTFEIMPDQPGATYVVLKRAPRLVFHERDSDPAPMPLTERGEP